jgi:hypothetical protein
MHEAQKLHVNCQALNRRESGKTSKQLSLESQAHIFSMGTSHGHPKKSAKNGTDFLTAPSLYLDLR